MRLLKMIGVLTLSALFAVSCSKEAGTTNGPQEGDCPEEMILDIKFPGQSKPSHMEIDNQRKKITLDFAEGVVPSNVELKLILEDGVTMKDPSENPFVLDLTKTCPIVLAYAGKDYRYLVIANHSGNDDGNVMRDGPVSDMALMYYGGSHRIGMSDWTSEQLRSNVVYQDRNGKEHWLFDSFLFLETSDGGGHYFDSGFDDPNNPRPNEKGANKSDWTKILDKYFAADGPIARLDKEVGNAIQRVSVPVYKRRVVIFLPVPFYRQTNWGTLSGKAMDFSVKADRVEASKWYVDEVIRRFNKLNANYLALDGIYYVAEQLTNNRDYIPTVADYIKSKNLKFYWIPYWGADGMGEWKNMKFDTAFLQPNYAFPQTKPDYDSHFKSIMNFASSKGMDLEMEFDEYALYNNKLGDYRADRVRDYLRAFKAYGVTTKNKIAYYQSNCMVHSLKTSEYKQDNDLYHEICTMIVERQRRRGED